jgi:Tol biopolymer transport system component
VLLASACGHAQPRAAGHYLVYGRNFTAVPSIVLARADGSGARTIAHGHDAVVSPDGRWIAFDADIDTGRGNIYKLFVVSTGGGKTRLLARTDSWPTWTPSSDRIWTFKGDALVSIDLRGHLTVLDRSSTIGDWSFSPDGRGVVYNAGGGLAVMRSTGADRHSLTHADDDGAAVWGTHWIAFGRADGGIWRIRPDGSGLRRILAGPRQPNPYNIVGYVPVAWSPDEQALLARIVTPHAWDVGIRVDVATGRFTRVHGYPVGLSRDGRFALAFGGRPTGGPGGGALPPPEWIAALPFGHRGGRRLLVRGDVCCPSWNR